jgi:hypothetical protein
LYILIFKFFDKRQHKTFWTEWQQALPEFNYQRQVIITLLEEGQTTEKMVFAVVLSQNRPVAYPVRIMMTNKGKVSISLVKSSEESLHLASTGHSVHASLKDSVP